MQDERQPFGRRQRLENDEHGQPDRIGKQRLLLGIGTIRGADDRIRDVNSGEILAPRLAGPELIEAQASDDRRQPGAEVVDAARVGAVQPEPGLLDGVVGLGYRAEHPVGHRPQSAVGGSRSDPPANRDRSLGSPSPDTFRRLVDEPNPPKRDEEIIG